MSPFELFLGFALALWIALVAVARGALSGAGAVGATGIGAIIFAAGGLPWAILLVAFFVTSSALSQFKQRAKEPLAEKFQKGQRRDLGQVLANGGAGALLALAFGIAPHPLWFVAFAGAIAAVNADTWATELGVLSQTPPRAITTGRIVPTGTSGGVTPLGTCVALCGAGLIGGLASLGQNDLGAGKVFVAVTLAGFLGSLCDSLLGATAQAIYFCDAEQTETEARVHRCGRATRLLRGWRWLDNDRVNFLASACGAIIAAGMCVLIG